jgi:3-oxoacyl-[acyl-carrier protein] reductase
MNIIITGANRGIGFELTVLFLAGDHNVLTISRSTEKLQTLHKKYAKTLTVLKFDLEKSTSLPLLLKKIKEEFRHVDILVNNAGLLFNADFEKISPGQLRSSMEVNYIAPYLLVQGALPLLKKAKAAHVINISSMGGIQNTQKYKGLSSYTPAKAALIALTECLAEELKETKIKTNCLALGAVQTEMLEKAFPGYKAPVSPVQMAMYIYNFALSGAAYFNGKTIPVSGTNP